MSHPLREARKLRFACLLSAACAVANAHAQGPSTPGAGYPSKPVRLIVPASPSGGLDQVARMLEGPLSGIWQQPVVVDNRPGAGVMVGSEVASKAQPDGYTLLIVNSNLPTNAIFYEKLAVVKGLVPVTLIALQPSALAVAASLPAKSVPELIALAKSSKLSYGSAGHGTLGHLTGELFRLAIGANILHVPYKGGGPIVIGLASGEISMAFTSLPSFLPHKDGGRIRILAVTSAKRSPVVPDIPTVGESLPGFAVEAWTGMLAPAGTPREVLTKIGGDVAKALNVREVRDRLVAQSFEVQAGSAEGFRKLLDSDLAKYQKVIQQAGLKVK